MDEIISDLGRVMSDTGEMPVIETMGLIETVLGLLDIVEDMILPTRVMRP